MSLVGGILGNIIGGTISGAINAAQNANKKPSGSSSGSSSGGSSSSRPSSGGSSSSGSSGGGGVPIGTGKPGNFTGSAGGIVAGNDFEQSIIDQMNKNSAAWWEAKTKEERDALHKQNQELAGLLGGNISYDGTTGTWSGSTNGMYQPQDQSEYLKEMYAAYLEQQRAALEQAYQNNLSNLQAEQDKLAGNYQSAKNQTAAQSALSQQRYNETAAAYGLNTGTAGQAALSFSNQLQADISELQAAESAANAEIERQRTNLGKEYENAMVQAQAENNYELFNALYQEAVRVDQALQNQSQFNSQLAMQQYQNMLDKYYRDKEWGFTQEQWEYQKQQDQYNRELESAQLLASMGDYSAYGKLLGWDQSKINQMNNAWAASNTRRYSSGGSSGGSSSAGSANGSITDPVQAAYDSGVRSYASALAYFKSLGYGDSMSMEFANAFLDEYESGGLSVNMNKVYQYYNNIVDAHEPGIDKGSSDYVPMMIMRYNDQGYLNANEVKELFRLFGLDPNDYGA